MKNGVLQKIILTTLFLNVLIPFVAYASHTQQIPVFPHPYWGTNPPLLPCGPGTGHDCTSVCEIFVLVQRVIYLAITLVVFAIAPLLLVWGGIRILTSAGSPEQFGAGKKILTGTVVGIALTLGAFIIVNTFFWMIGLALGSSLSNWSSIACG